MTVTIADLQARVSAVGVEETKQAVASVGDAAQQTATVVQRAYELMAQAAVKQGAGGSVADWVKQFQQANVQPNAAALADAARSMQATAAATQQATSATDRLAASTRSAVQAAQELARINASAPMAAMLDARAKASADAMVQERRATQDLQQRQLDFARQQRFGGIYGGPAGTRTGAQESDDRSAGAGPFGLSDNSIARFSAGVVGISLGLSLVAGAARLVHDAIVGTVDAQVQWEQSMVRTTMLYGSLAPSVVAMSQAQSQAPGLLGSQQEFITANLNAAYLSTRFGVPQAEVFGLTSAAGRVSSALSLDAQGRADLQARALAFAEGGGSSLRPYGIEGDPLSIARGIGGVSAAQLQALTPQQLRDVQTQIATAGLARDAILGSSNQPGLLQAQNQREKALTEAQGNLQNALENLRTGGGGGVAGRSELALATNFPLLGPAGELQQRADLGLGPGTGNPSEPRPDIPALTKAVADAKAAYDAAAKEVGDNVTALARASATIEKAGVAYGSAAFRLLGFTGSLEDSRSIARGDIAAQAQAAVASRGVSAIPSIGTPMAEINFQGTQTAWAQAYQNYVAQQAQQSGDNAIRDWLSLRAGQEGPNGAAEQAMQRALRAEPIQQQQRRAQQQQDQIGMAAAERQAQLDQISLTQRERYVQMMQQTVQLRLQDNSLQQQAIRASADVIRAQQAALPSQRTASAAQYQQNLAQAYGQQRIARLIQGQDVSGLPSIDDLIQMNVQGQFAAAENAPGLVQAQRGIEVAQQGATAISLQDALVQSSIRLQEIQLDAKNLQDIPRQTALNLEVVEIQRASIAVQSESRDYLKQLVEIATRSGGSAGSVDLGDLIFGSGGNIPVPQNLAGARRGPF